MTHRANDFKRFEFHTDFADNFENQKTAIFYMNTCNGGTVFQDKTEIQSEENKAIIFDGNTEHKAKINDMNLADSNESNLEKYNNIETMR